MVAACAGDGGQGGRGGRLHLFTFSDYIDPQLVREFEQAHGVQVLQDYYDNNEALIAKLQAGGRGQYDVAVVSDYALPTLVRLGLLEPLDRTSISNFSNVDPRFLGRDFDPDNQYSVPYQWGVSGIGIRTDLVDTTRVDVRTWAVLFDPSRQAGAFTMLDDSRETIGAALKYLGYSLNTTDPAALAAAERLLLAQRDRVLSYASFSTSRDLLLSGDVALAHNWSGDIGLAQAERPDITFVVPREGSVIWIDNLAVPAGAPNRQAAELFMNFILDAEVGARLSEYTRYASPNRAAEAYLSPELKAMAQRYLDPAAFARMEYLRDLGDEGRQLYDRVWTRVRVAGG